MAGKRTKNKSNPPAPPALVVGIGASAGGIAALKQVFASVPADSGLAYVVLVHFPAHTQSLLPGLLAETAAIPAIEAADGGKILPNHIYVIPGGVNADIFHGVFHLADREDSDKALPIDFLFRSLARDQGSNAAAIVLSGTGSDGSRGVKEIRIHDGLVFAQKPETADYPDMPTHAIATGAVDMVLAPEEMAAKLVFNRSAVPFDEGTLETGPAGDERWLTRIFAVVRSRTGHDFSMYKRSTIVRRMARRMTLHGLDTLEDYLRFLGSSPEEIEQLFHEFLIGVTHFFRDKAVFESLAAKHLPEIIRRLDDGATLRAWVPGCSTGEEAYTVAIAIQEAIDLCPEHRVEHQVFGTDVDERAIEKARSGFYPSGIASDVTETRLKRYFVAEGDGYRVRKELRNRVVFSTQNLLSDPPFSHLHFVSCRNVLIYLDGEAQEKLIRLFHFTLEKDALLVLGTSETTGKVASSFVDTDKANKIFARKEVPASVRGKVEFPRGSSTIKDDVARDRPLVSPQPVEFEEITRRALLDAVVPPTALIDSEGTIVYAHGRVGRYLETPSGPVTNNVVSMARPGLRLELSAAIRAAHKTNDTIFRPHISIRDEDTVETVGITVVPLQSPVEAVGYCLVSFQPNRSEWPEKRVPEEGDTFDHARFAHLEEELNNSRSIQQATIEQLESAIEELRSTNEELHSSNEELQSTNEEMESSREEAQSLNEELNTINSELESKVEALSAANDDMQNLLNATEVGTIFVDMDLNIRRFNDRAVAIVNLIKGDIGRPLHHVSSNIQYGDLMSDVASAIDSLIPVGREVVTADGRWYQMRIRPYRTTNNVIEGAVLVFFDIHDQKLAQGALEHLMADRRSAFDVASYIIDQDPRPLLVLDSEGTVRITNASLRELFHTGHSKLAGQDFFSLAALEKGSRELRQALDVGSGPIAEFSGTTVSIKTGKTLRRYAVAGKPFRNDPGTPFHTLLIFERQIDEKT